MLFFPLAGLKGTLSTTGHIQFFSRDLKQMEVPAWEKNKSKGKNKQAMLGLQIQHDGHELG